MVLVHGYYELSPGNLKDFDRLEQTLSNKYEIKTQRVCFPDVRRSEARNLNRTARRTCYGFQLAGYQRQAGHLAYTLESLDGRPCSAPGADSLEDKLEAAEMELHDDQARQYCLIAARCLYLIMHRPEVQCAVKECCLEMSRPTHGSRRSLKRVGQFRSKRAQSDLAVQLAIPRRHQGPLSGLDRCACKQSRKSTSCGVVMIGNHCVKVLSQTQAMTAISSANAELCATVEAATEALGAQLWLLSLESHGVPEFT